MTPTYSLQDRRAILRAAAAFAVEIPGRTWREVLPTLALAAFLQAALLSPLPLAIRLPLALLFALVLLRVFMFFHDVQHGAIFRRSPFGRLLVNAFSLYFIYSPSVWQSRHDAHHRHNSVTNAREVPGQIPMLTLSCWRTLSPRARRLYRIFRHPLAVALGLLPYFVLPSWNAFREDPSRYWTAPLWIACPPAIVLAMAWYTDALTAAIAFVLPLLVSGALGSYLFYAQHSFEGVQYQVDSVIGCVLVCWLFFDVHAAVLVATFIIGVAGHMGTNLALYASGVRSRPV